MTTRHIRSVHPSPEKDVCGAAHSAPAHAIHPRCCCWGVLWLAVTSAGEGPGDGNACPFPVHWEEETFCQHLDASVPYPQMNPNFTES